MGIDKEKSLPTAGLHPPRADEATERLVHEREVYQIEAEMQNIELRRAQEELEGQQIELELQNDELRRAQSELELSRNKFAELYDFAPVGYFTFAAGGTILDVNFAGSQLLGIDKNALIDKTFTSFIADPDGRDIFSRHLETVLKREGMQRCEVRVTKNDGTVIHGQLQSVSVDDVESKEGHILSSIVDGTVAKQLQTEIQEAREYAENIVETVHKPLVVLDSDLKIITANLSFYETFKVTAEETIGNFIYDLGNRQWDIPKLRVLFEDILPHESMFNGYEVEHTFPGIGRKVILLNAREIFREKIGSHIILLAMEDITERKQFERALRENEEQLSVTLNSIGDAVIATDAEARVTRMNPVAEHLTGWTRDEAVGRPVNEIFHIVNKDTRQLAPIPVLAAIANGTIQGLANHTVLIARDGSEYDIADSCAPIRNRSSQVVGAVLVFSNVTEEYAVQQSLRDSASLMRAILSTVVDGIITIHAQHGIIETVNPAAEKMFGYTAAELDGQNFSLLIPELDQDQLYGSLEYYSASEEALAIGQGREVMGRRKDGSFFPLELAASEMQLGGQRYFTGILRDTTSRKLAEEALLKAGALQSAIFNSANFSSIATDAKGVIQIFNVGAERMLGYTAAEVMNKISPADISDPQEVIARAEALSIELDTPITPGFEALVFKASRGIEDIYELTYIRKDGSRFPAVVSVTALRDDQDTIIGYLLIGTDNTARKQAEEALLKAGALQSAIFNSANFSSIATDAKGVIQIFNVGAERMLGYSAVEVMNLITPAEISDPQEVIARAEALSIELDTPITPGFEALVFKASRGIEDIYELTYIRKDGSRFPAVVSVTALRDDQDAIIGYLLIGTDNTARKQAEEALLKAGALQSAIFNSANFSSIATDAKGVIQIFNVGAERMLGYTADEVMNKITPADISDPQEVIARAEALSIELETPITPGFEALVFKASRGIEDIYELTYIRKDGSRFPAVVSVTALRDAQDAIIGYLLIGTDNTARKQAEEALLKAGALQSAIFNSANFSSIATDAKGVIQIFNVGAERMLGYSAAEVMNLITPAEISDPQEVIARAEELSIELGTPITPGFEALVFKASRGIEDIYELTYIRKDGSRFPAVVSVTALRDDQDAIIGFLLIGTDNTARKQVEAERIRLEQVLQDKNIELERATLVAEKANLAKSDFLSSMSHELRTPLSAILGFAQLMESGSPQPTPSQKRSIDQILKAGWYLLELINEILDLAVIESGKLSMSLEPVSLSEIIHECETMVEPQAKKHGISVTFVHFETPCFVRADRTRVKQVLINLLSNAIKYNKAGGTVLVESVLNGSDSVRISVRDTGEGLSAEKLAQLFQPFNRLGQEANAEQGTGIGLVVCKRLVEWMGGVIGVESTVGVGSVFWIELNLTEEPQEIAHAVDTAVVGQAPSQVKEQLYTLLYVEDNPANLMLVEDIIERRPDIRLLSALDGKSGIELARTSLPDVILMDIHLPGINGIDAMKILAVDPATAHIPVVALSANAIPRDIEKGLEAGFFRYLTKPINVNEFLETLDVTLKFAKERAARAAKE